MKQDDAEDLKRELEQLKKLAGALNETIERIKKQLAEEEPNQDGKSR